MEKIDMQQVDKCMSKKRDSRIVQGEFDKLYLEYKPKLMKFVSASIEDKSITEDIVQETFYEALRKFDVFRKHPHQIGWLYKAAGYKIKEYLRKMQPQNEIWLEQKVLEEIPGVEDSYADAEAQIVLYETLTQDELLRFRRYFIWGETTAEIAEKEKITENNMRVRLSRLRQKIESTICQR